MVTCINIYKFSFNSLLVLDYVVHRRRHTCEQVVTKMLQLQQLPLIKPVICPVVGTTVKIIIIESSRHVYVDDLHLVTYKKQETVFCFFSN